MKKPDRVILHREALYQEIWETPNRQLAKKYGISDVGLAKICKRMQIPIPHRGYWAKVAHGHEPRKQSLPALDGNGLAQVVIDKSAEELLRIARQRLATSQQRNRENERIHKLKKKMTDWENSQRIRTYVTAMRTTDSTTDATDPEFLDWAGTYADHLDPTVDFRIEVLDMP